MGPGDKERIMKKEPQIFTRTNRQDVPVSDAVLEAAGSVLTNNEHDVTEKFIQGAKESLKKGLNTEVEIAILKSRSPSCGIGSIYDGTFTHSLIDGDGIFAHLCRKSGITCISSDDSKQIKKTLEKLK